MDCDNFLPGWSWKRFILLLLDNIISGLMIGPLVVFYWRGTWVLVDRHVLPDVILQSDGTELRVTSSANGWFCFVLANIGLFVIVCTQHLLERLVKINSMHPAIRLVYGDVHGYVVAFLNVCHWRGVWVLLDYYTGTGPISAWASAAIGKKANEKCK